MRGQSLAGEGDDGAGELSGLFGGGQDSFLASQEAAAAVEGGGWEEEDEEDDDDAAEWSSYASQDDFQKLLEDATRNVGEGGKGEGVAADDEDEEIFFGDDDGDFRRLLDGLDPEKNGVDGGAIDGARRSDERGGRGGGARRFTRGVDDGEDGSRRDDGDAFC